MPVYEYLCDDCDGIFEAVKPMKEADEPAPCPVCDLDGQRMMPTQFTAFIMRKGYPRRIPDKGTYWHLGTEVSYLPRSAKAYEHPQVKKERRTDPPSKSDIANLTESKIQERRAKRNASKMRRTLARDARARNLHRAESAPPRSKR